MLEPSAGMIRWRPVLGTDNKSTQCKSGNYARYASI